MRDLKSATADANKTSSNNRYRFPSGAGACARVSRQVISHLINNADALQRLAPLGRIELTGTDSVREISRPYKNPLEYISQLRDLNGNDCILSIPVPEARQGRGGSVPVYYSLSVDARFKWIDALKRK